MFAAEREVLTVGELTRRLKLLVEGAFPPVWVRGEIGNLTAHSSGHLYFTLRDERAQLRCVMFRRYREALRFRPREGLEVEVRGRVGVYERGGSYELLVELLRPVGMGEQELALAALREKLAGEGLFDLGRKRPLPPFPERIGVVTSPTGAAIHDILRVLARRAPGIRVILRPTRVQGEGAAEEIAGAVDEFNRYGEVDLLIVGRGGGSAEDLWPFNEEAVVRSVARSRITVISAVGHETDVTLCDLAADLRAPTPSAAAELASPDREALRQALATSGEGLRRLLTRRIERDKERFHQILSRYGWRRLPGLVREWTERRDELEARLGRAVSGTLGRERSELAPRRARLEALDPSAVLARGYAVARRGAGGPAVRDARELTPGERIRVRFHRGEAECLVERILAVKEA